MLVELNPEQLAAAQHGDGPLLIVAGAGTGKTATLVHRVACLIERGADPRRILLLTFTRRAAAEMLRRVEAVLAARGHGSGGASDRVWGGTFHAAAARLLRIHARDIGMEPDFTIMDRGDAEDLLHVARTRLGLGRGSARFPQKSTCLDVYSRCVNAQLPLNEVLRTALPLVPAGRGGSGAAVRRLHGRQGGAAGPGLRRPAAVLARPARRPGRRRPRARALRPRARRRVPGHQRAAGRHRQPAAPDGTGVTCVGDDAQAIYAFRAATVRNILDFEQRFPGAEVVTLTQNYRSTAPILAATNALIAEAAERRDKDLWTDRAGGGRPVLATCRDEDEQTQWLCERILAHREQGTQLKEQAVLFRAQHHSMALEMELSRRNIPFHKYGGLRFVEMAHVKDLVAFLRLAENPSDAMAGLRVLGLVPGIGPKTAAALLESLSAAAGDFPTAWAGAGVPEPARAAWPAVVELFATLAAAGPSEVPAQVHAVRSVYGPLLERRYDNVQARLRDLEQIEAARRALRRRARSSSPSSPSTRRRTRRTSPARRCSTRTTSSSARCTRPRASSSTSSTSSTPPTATSRRTWPPAAPTEIEEERRLLYVACTRAREQLYVSHPLRYYTQPWAKADTHGYAQRSRFLTQAVVAHFEELQTGPEGTQSDDGPLERVTTASIRASVRSLWE